jgi:acyl-coenzyme A synthetase/AMP-(fatty) acid ligase
MLPIKPGSAGIPPAGIEAAVVSTDGQPLAPGEKGVMIVRRPFPGYSRSSENTSAITEAGSLLTGGGLCGNMPLPQFDCT